MRVLHIVGRMDRAGAETMLMNLYRNIDRDRVQFDFLYLTDSACDYDEELLSLGARVFRITGLAARLQPLRAFRLFRLLRAHPEITAVHCHMLLASGLHMLAARAAGRTVRVAHAHLTGSGRRSSHLSRAYERISRYLLHHNVTLPLTCGREAGRYLFPKREDTVYLPNAIDLEAFTFDAPTAHGGGGPDRPLQLLQVGRLADVKNPFFSLEVAKMALNSGREVVLTYAGDGPLFDRLLQTVRAEGLEDQVRLLGKRSDVRELMLGADVLLMPSRLEGFPVVLVEAQALGLPVVASSSISAEVDLGLGLIEFLPTDAATKWLSAVDASAAKPPIQPDQAQAALRRSGFDASESARRLLRLYKG